VSAFLFLGSKLSLLRLAQAKTRINLTGWAFCFQLDAKGLAGGNSRILAAAARFASRGSLKSNYLFNFSIKKTR
ncbi:MAG: hypothetical protein WBN28_12185, partial [Lutimonas sp.]